MTNIDQQEVKKFSDIAEEWWNKDGDFKPLHVINPLRANYIKEKIELKDKKVLDVGCGGGLLCESLYDFGAIVTGIDAAGPGIEVAKIHAQKNNKNIKYFEKTAEQLNTEYIEYYDVVTCLEVLEHVPDPESLIKTCVQLLKPGGLLFLSTINKNPRSWITAIVGAEYIFNLLPKGTHEFDKFIKDLDAKREQHDQQAKKIAELEEANRTRQLNKLYRDHHLAKTFYGGKND